MRPRAVAVLLLFAAACGGGALDGIDTSNQIKPDPLAVGSWDMERARAEPASVLPFACETAADKISWPCINGAVTDTIVSGIAVLTPAGTYGFAIAHRVKLAGTTLVIDRVTDEQGLENAGGARIGTWARSAARLVFYPASFASAIRYGDLSDSAFVHGNTTMTLNGARFLFR